MDDDPSQTSKIRERHECLYDITFSLESSPDSNPTKNIILSYCERITGQPNHYERQRVGAFDKVFAGVHKTITGHQIPSLTILIK